MRRRSVAIAAAADQARQVAVLLAEQDELREAIGPRRLVPPGTV